MVLWVFNNPKDSQTALPWSSPYRFDQIHLFGCKKIFSQHLCHYRSLFAVIRFSWGGFRQCTAVRELGWLCFLFFSSLVLGIVTVATVLACTVSAGQFRQGWAKEKSGNSGNFKTLACFILMAISRIVHCTSPKPAPIPHRIALETRLVNKSLYWLEGIPKWWQRPDIDLCMCLYRLIDVSALFWGVALCRTMWKVLHHALLVVDWTSAMAVGEVWQGRGMEEYPREAGFFLPKCATSYTNH